VIETQDYDLTHLCHVYFWFAKTNLMTLLKMFLWRFLCNHVDLYYNG
jgi:hypothetical protein